MATTTFSSGTVVEAQWLNDVNDQIYDHVFNVKNSTYGAVGDDSTDDTAAINIAIAAAIAGGGGTVFFPEGTYKITGALATVSGSSITFLGVGQFHSILKQYTTTANVINNTGSSNQYEKIGITYNGTPAATAVAINSTGANTMIRDVIITKAYIGINFQTGTGQKASNFQIQNYVAVGVLMTSVSDVFLDSFIMNAGNATNGSLGGIRMVDLVQAVFASNGDIINGVYSMTTTASVYAVSVRPAYNTFTGVFFDSAAKGTLLEQLVETIFTGCWFSGGQSGAGFNGMTINESEDNKFIGCRFFNCGYHGAAIGTSTAVNTTFVNCSFQDNSITAASGVGHGIGVAANANDFTITNCTASNGLYTGGRQGYGIDIAAGTSTRFIIKDNQLTGNITGGLADASTGTNKWIKDNITGASTTVASAATITLPASDEPFITISGTTNITSVTASWVGRVVTLHFQDVLNFTDGSNLKLASTLATTADDTITLISNGTNWYETGRSVN